MQLLFFKVEVAAVSLRLCQCAVQRPLILGGKIVSAKGCIYSPAAFAQEDATAREVAKRLAANLPVEGNLDTVLASVKSELGLQTYPHGVMGAVVRLPHDGVHPPEAEARHQAELKGALPRHPCRRCVSGKARWKKRWRK